MIHNYFQILIVMFSLGALTSCVQNQGIPKSSIEVSLRTDEKVYRIGERIMLKYMIKNKGTAAFSFYNVSGSLTAEALRLTLPNGKRAEEIPLGYSPMIAEPTPQDFVTLKPGESYIHVQTGELTKKILLDIDKIAHEGVFLEFIDSSFCIPEAGNYSLQWKFSSMDLDSAEIRHQKITNFIVIDEISNSTSLMVTF